MDAVNKIALLITQDVEGDGEQQKCGVKDPNGNSPEEKEEAERKKLPGRL